MKADVLTNKEFILKVADFYANLDTYVENDKEVYIYSHKASEEFIADLYNKAFMNAIRKGVDLVEWCRNHEGHIARMFMLNYCEECNKPTFKAKSVYIYEGDDTEYNSISDIMEKYGKKYYEVRAKIHTVVK